MIEHLNKIYDLIRGKIKEIFSELEPRESGKNFSVICPDCKKRDAFIGPVLPLIYCNHRTNCGFKMTFWDYLQRRDGWSQGDTLRGMAALVGYNLPALSTEQAARIERDNEDARTREKAFMIFRSWFEGESEAKPAREYLAGRGWSGRELDPLDGIQEIGYFNVKLLERDIAAGMIAAGPVLDFIKEIIPGLPGGGKAHPLAIPWRSRGGKIEAFQFRAIDGETRPPYLFIKGTEKGKILFNLPAARAARTDEIYIVEGVIDALRLTAGGLPNVVALGGCEFNDEHIRLLNAAKFKHAILILDFDQTGEGGAEKAIRLLSAAGVHSSFMQLPEGIKDPDLFLRSGRTVEELKALPIISGLSWLAERMFKIDEKNVNERRRAFDRVIELAQTARFHLKDHEELFKTLERHGTPPDTLTEIYEGIKARQKKEDADKRVKEAFKTAQKKIEAGAATDEVFKIIEAARPEVRTEAKPVKNFIEFLKEKREAERRRDPSKPLGLPLNKFKNLEHQTDGIQAGLYLIGAGPNVGKTAFSVNIVIDLIKTNQELTVYFYTLDDSKSIIVNRFLGAMTGRQINKIQKGFSTSEDDNRQIDEAYETLARWNKQGRLYVKDIEEIKHIADIENDVKSEKDAGRAVIVFIDALYNLQVDTMTGTGIREMNIDRAIQIKGIVDKYEIPLFCTVEIRKNPKRTSGQDKTAPTLDDIMETGKFAYNANLVWILHSAEGQREGEPHIDVEISCVKNKLNYDKKKRDLKFYPQTSIIDEVKERL
jgi:DNA primase